MYPVLFELGSIFVSSIWILVSLGFLASGITLIQLTGIKSMKMVFLVKNFFPMLIWGVIAGRLLYIILNIQEIFADPIQYAPMRMIGIWDRGFEFWGVTIGVLLYLYFTAKKAEENIWRWIDILVVSILAGIPFGHIGALLDGVNFGRETDLPWGITFESSSVPYTVPIHPTQIYALVYSIIIFLILGYIFIKKPLKHDGDIALIAAISYGTMRFVEEFFRGDESITIFDMNIAYPIILIIVAIAGISLAIRYNRLTFITNYYHERHSKSH